MVQSFVSDLQLRFKCTTNLGNQVWNKSAGYHSQTQRELKFELAKS